MWGREEITRHHSFFLLLSWVLCLSPRGHPLFLVVLYLLLKGTTPLCRVRRLSRRWLSCNFFFLCGGWTTRCRMVSSGALGTHLCSRFLHGAQGFKPAYTPTCQYVKYWLSSRFQWLIISHFPVRQSPTLSPRGFSMTICLHSSHDSM